MAKVLFLVGNWALGSTFHHLWDVSNVSKFRKILSRSAVVRQLVSKIYQARNQVPLYLQRIKPILKCALRNLVPFVQAKACNFTKVNTPPWVFFSFFKLYEWYEIAQRTTYYFCDCRFLVN